MSSKVKLHKSIGGKVQINYIAFMGKTIMNYTNTTYHIIIADGRAKRRNLLIPVKASIEKGIRVALQEFEKLI